MKISINKFLKIGYLSIAILLLVAIGSAFVKFTINLDKETITAEINKKMPFEKEIVKTIPLINKEIKLNAFIESAKVDFKQDKLIIYSNGYIKHKDTEYHFKSNSTGNVEYNNENLSFYFKPDNLDIDITNVINTKSDILAGNYDRLNEMPLEEVIEGFFARNYKKASQKIKETVGENIDIKKAVEKTIETGGSMYLSGLPIYKLKDNEKENMVKTFLSDVKINEDGIVMQLTTVNLLKHSIFAIFVIAMIGLFLFGINQKTKKRGSVHFGEFFEIIGGAAFEVAVESASTVGKGLGEGLEAVGEGIGDVVSGV